MPKYDVHLYAVVCKKIVGVEAVSPEKAAEKAEIMASNEGIQNLDGCDYADDVLGALVDHENDPDFLHTCYVPLLEDDVLLSRYGKSKGGL